MLESTMAEKAQNFAVRVIRVKKCDIDIGISTFPTNVPTYTPGVEILRIMAQIRRNTRVAAPGLPMTEQLYQISTLTTGWIARMLAGCDGAPALQP